MRHRTSITGTASTRVLCLLIITATAWCSAAGPDRQPVPDRAAVEKARRLVGAAYEEQFRTSGKPEQRDSLRNELLDAVDATGDPVEQYALLAAAEELARGNIDTVFAIIDKRATLFEVDALQSRVDLLTSRAGPKGANGDAVLLDHVMQVAMQAARAEQFEIANDMASLALNIATKAAAKAAARKPPSNVLQPQKVNGPALIKAAKQMQDQISSYEKRFVEYRKSVAALEAQPDDPEGNRIVAEYLCFVAKNWEKGLPYLSKSKIHRMGDLAKEELALRKADPRDPKKLFELAEKWWDARSDCRLHAALLYQEVLPQLTDLERRKAENRIKQAGPQPQLFIANPADGKAGDLPQGGATIFLSDLPEQNPTVGYGVFGKNGDMGYEGRKIIVGGKASPKSISMHPPSDGMAQVTYSVPDGCTHFSGRAAIGDGTDSQSIAVTFRVKNERGDVLWESKPIDRTGAGEECNIALRGAKSVTLAVACPGSSFKAWAVWVDPRFIR